jgi:GNAT superfamily N-acetyltransferase
MRAYGPAPDGDVELVTETIALAFANDPVWGVALRRKDGSTAHHRPFWRLYVEGSLRCSGAYMIGDGAAVSVWVPPGCTELSTDQEAELAELIESSLDPDAAGAMVALWERFSANHPHDEPHAYLSLLATHPDHRGQGIGQQLLALDLARYDMHRTPTYLESTNPANDHRYERAGFRRIGGFLSVIDGAPISMMWREASPTAV